MQQYTTRERFQSVMRDGDVSKGLPVVEWAGWWNLTYDNWIRQGAPEKTDLSDWYGLDKHHQIWYRPRRSGNTRVANEADYNSVLPDLYPTPQFDSESMEHHRKLQESGEGFLHGSEPGKRSCPNSRRGGDPYMQTCRGAVRKIRITCAGLCPTKGAAPGSIM